VFVINVNASEVFEETITVNTDVGKTSSKSGSDSGIVEVKYVSRPTPAASTVPVVVHRRRHGKSRLRKRCCTAGQLAGKHGLSCHIPRNYRSMFFNLITSTRQKYQGTVSKNARGRFRSKTMFRIYNHIKECVKRSKKGVVQKCCLGYKKKMSRRSRG
jgi:hypothetical protein